MSMTSEELTYQMAREQVNQWRGQLRRLNRRDGLDAWDRGMAEGLATAIREMDRVLDASPICKQWQEAAR